MKQFVFLLFLLLHAPSFCQVQKMAAVRLEENTFEADDFVGLDGFGNFFYLKNNILFKKTPTRLLQYQNLALGNIKKADVINPLKVVVFYEEFNTAVLLDNQMNEIQKLEFSKNETPIIASAVGMSGQNKLWIYNSADQQIGLYDSATNQYKSLAVPIKENLLFYQTDFNYFHWIDTQGRWYSCSVFGRITDNGPVSPHEGIQLLEQNRFLYSNANGLFFSDRSNMRDYQIEIVEKSFVNFYYKDQILSIFTPKGITNYKITLP